MTKHATSGHHRVVISESLPAALQVTRDLLLQLSGKEPVAPQPAQDIFRIHPMPIYRSLPPSPSRGRTPIIQTFRVLYALVSSSETGVLPDASTSHEGCRKHVTGGQRLALHTHHRPWHVAGGNR